MAYTCKRLKCQTTYKKFHKSTHTLVTKNAHRNAARGTAVGGELLHRDHHSAAGQPHCIDTVLLPYVSLNARFLSATLSEMRLQRLV
jgi:hypothetical protein